MGRALWQTIVSIGRAVHWSHCGRPLGTSVCTATGEQVTLKDVETIGFLKLNTKTFLFQKFLSLDFLLV